jgi:DNA helicase-2/ATP-dependent DNA helicase PcrA
MPDPKVPSYLSILNPEQLSAVQHEGSPLLILAGAGSGKTRVITTKIAYLIRERGIDPESILAVTFTNKAAREMAERARTIESRSDRVMIRTFHSFGAWFLRRNGPLAGLDPNFVIYDDDDMVTLLSTLMDDLSRTEVAAVAHRIARAKDYFLGPQDPDLAIIDHRQEFRRIYAQYEERLAKIGNVDFGDLIKKPLEILRSHEEVRSRFHQRFRVILVDEYQDSNVAQFELLKALWGSETYLCVVGDDDQSIYRFRGAEVRNILEFPQRFPQTQIIRLERNYRSISPILRVASAVVDHNSGRLGKTLQAERGSGRIPTVAFLPDQDAETSFCAELIQRSRSAGANYSDWAILYRTNAQSLGFETEFLHRKIPYRVVGSLKFYEREEVKDALALLAFSVNPRDEVAFKRVVNKPSRGVGTVTVDRILVEAATQTQGNLVAAGQSLLPRLSAKARGGLTGFLQAIQGARDLLTEDVPPLSSDPSATEASLPVLPPLASPSDEPPPLASGQKGKQTLGRRSRGGAELVGGEGLSQVIVALLRASGLQEYHQAQDEIAGTQRLANLQELVNAATLYPATPGGLAEFLEHIELDRSMAENEDSADSVTLITVHNTKGLEFRRVIITGLEQGIFPRDDKKDEDLEEERRLFYVGATRAMDELYLTTCALRRIYGRTMPNAPSLFLSEIPSENLRVLGRAPYGVWSPKISAKAKDPTATGAFAPAGASPATGGFPNKTSSDGRWRLGGRLFHDDYGYGTVTAIRETEEGPLISARFETGKELTFVSRYQSERFMRIQADD